MQLTNAKRIKHSPITPDVQPSHPVRAVGCAFPFGREFGVISFASKQYSFDHA
jgi:hypothetical protein